MYTRHSLDGIRVGKTTRPARLVPIQPAQPKAHHQPAASAQDQLAVISIRFTVPGFVHNKLAPSIRRYPYMWALGTALGLILVMFLTILLVGGVHMAWHTVHKQPLPPQASYLRNLNLLKGVS